MYIQLMYDGMESVSPSAILAVHVDGHYTHTMSWWMGDGGLNYILTLQNCIPYGTPYATNSISIPYSNSAGLL